MIMDAKAPARSGRFSSLAPMLLVAARLAGSAVGLITQVLLARYLSSDGLGLFFSATSAAAVIGLIAARGYPQVVNRFVGRYRERGKPELVSMFVYQMRRDAALSTVVAVAVLIAFALLWPTLTAESRYAALAATLGIPAIVALRIHGSIAAAIRRFGLAYLPDTCIRAFLFLLTIGIVLALDIPFTLGVALLLVTIDTMIIAFGQYLLLRGQIDLSAKPVKDARMRRLWRSQSMPLIIVALITNLFADLNILVATALMPSAQVAVFGVCIKIALLVGFAVQASHQIAVPDLSEAHARKDTASIHAAVLRASGFPLALTLTATVFTAFWGDHVLRLFGEEFAGAALPLTILIACQFLRAAFGPSILLISIVGAQKANSAQAVAAALILIAATAVLAPSFGVLGAAWAVVLATVYWLIASAVVLRHISGYRVDLARLVAAGLSCRISAHRL